MAYEGEFRPGMVFECVSGPLMGERRTLVELLSSGVWNCAASTTASEAWLRGFTRLVSAPLVEESIAQPAARPLAEGWVDNNPRAPFWCSVDRIGVDGHAYSDKVPARYDRAISKSTTGHSRCAACESCAERAGVFADVAVAGERQGAGITWVAVDETATVSPAVYERIRQVKDSIATGRPTHAPPSCDWTCSREHGTHGPRCKKAQWTRQTVANASAMMARASIVGEYPNAAETASFTYRAWAAAQHGLPPESRPPAPRIRDCYREGDGADPDYVSGQGVR